MYDYLYLGFSMNKQVVQNTYWSKAALPKLKINNDYLDGYNIVVLYGLRLMVQVCSGEHCNNAGDDDFSHPLESNRIQDCYSNTDDDIAEDLCLNCRSAGLAAGSLSVFTLVAMLVALALTAARFAEGVDSVVIKYSGIGMHGAVMLLSFLALAIYGGQCYQNIVDYDYVGDDFINDNDINYSLGPGFALLLVAMLLQPVSMILSALVPEGSEGGLAKQEASSSEKSNTI